ncbi:MAG: succinylglutamate desuccinylase/aspartoacylase family protein [Candidatus Thorarchaeota archaeon]
MKEITIGTIKGVAGSVNYGFLDILEHPTGTIERLPIIIAQGKFDGPVLWLTANIHGDEYTGIPVIHQVINSLNLETMKGAIVAIPSLNPSGSRTKSRYPYYDKKDPNRLFPDGNPFKDKGLKIYEKISDIKLENTISEDVSDYNLTSETQLEFSIEREEKSVDPLHKFDRDDLYPSIQEAIWKKIFEIMKESADFLIDLHNAFIKSIPFIFLDRVLYNDEKGEEALKEAEILFSKTEEMVNAFGLTVIREATPKKYVQKKLHRSTSGAALNYLRIPSYTVELGMYLDVEPEVVEAAVTGILNVMKWSKMIEGELEEITQVPVLAKGEAVRYVGHPRIKKSAIIEMKVKKGDYVKKGDLIAEARDIFGRLLPDEEQLRTEIDGYIFMINEGILRYPNEEICWIASKDVLPMIDKWPK